MQCRRGLSVGEDSMYVRMQYRRGLSVGEDSV